MTKCTEEPPPALNENNFSELLMTTPQNTGSSSTPVDGNEVATSLATVVMETSHESAVTDDEGSNRCNVIVTSHQSLTSSSSSQTTASHMATLAANGPMPLLPSSSSSSSSYSSPSSTTTGGAIPLSEGTPATSCVTSSDDAIGQSNLIVNYLPAFMSQDDVRALFESMGQLESCKLVRDKNTGHSLGYGFVKFKSKEAAKNALKAFNGLRIQNKTIKVSYARPSSDVIKGANLYISGLSSEVTPHDLTEMFAKFGSIISVRILSDSVTGLSKGVAFIRFDLRSEAEAAVSELNGKVVFGAPITVKFASQPAVVLDTRTNQNQHPVSRPFNHHPYFGTRQGKSAPHVSNNDSSFTLHVHNLPANTSDSDVWSLFGPMGTVKSVKVIRDKVTGTCKGHALVSMPDPEQARSAVNLLNGLKFIGGNLIQVQLKGQKSKHSEAQKPLQPPQTLQDATRHQQQQQQQQQQVFLQRQQQLSFAGANAIQQVSHFPVILQQNSTTNDNNNNNNLSQQQQQQQQQQQHQLHLQQNFQLPAQLALHSTAPTALPGAILAHPAFYPAVIDASFVSGIQSTDFSSPNIFLSGTSGSIVGQNQLSSINIPPSGSHQVAGFTTHPSMGSYPITILHDI